MFGLCTFTSSSPTVVDEHQKNSIVPRAHLEGLGSTPLPLSLIPLGFCWRIVRKSGKHSTAQSTAQQQRQFPLLLLQDTHKHTRHCCFAPTEGTACCCLLPAAASSRAASCSLTPGFAPPAPVGSGCCVRQSGVLPVGLRILSGALRNTPPHAPQGGLH